MDEDDEDDESESDDDEDVDRNTAVDDGDNCKICLWIQETLGSESHNTTTASP
jgi:hypothetical protein